MSDVLLSGLGSLYVFLEFVEKIGLGGCDKEEYGGCGENRQVERVKSGDVCLRSDLKAKVCNEDGEGCEDDRDN